MTPILTVYRLDTSGGVRVQIVSKELKRITTKLQSEFYNSPVRIPFSFVTIELEIEASEWSTVRFLKNGRNLSARQRGKYFSTLFTTKYDNEMHRINVSVDGVFIGDIALLFCHQYVIKLEESKEVYSPKWSLDDWGLEFNRCSSLFDWLSDSSKLLENIPKKITKNTPESVEQWADELNTIAISLAKLTLPAKTNDFISDFAIEEPLVLDIQKILNESKRNHRLLEVDPTGAINVNGTKYSTHASEWRDEASSSIDLSTLIFLLDAYLYRLKNKACPPIVLDTLKRVRQHFTKISSLNNTRVTSKNISYFFLTPKKTTLSKLLLEHMSMLLMLAHWKGARSSMSEQAHIGLISGIRDFTLFEWATYRAIAKTFGLDDAALAEKKSILSIGEHLLINGNVPNAEQTLKKYLTGWRAESTQPAAYAPDMVILLSSKFPVIVDAKFRIGRSIEQLASADSLKDVQAYLDEFDRQCAIVIVPMIPAHIIGDKQLHCISGISIGSKKRIFVIEYLPTQEAQFQNNLLSALEQCLEVIS